MQLGSQEHQIEFLTNVLKEFQENAWKEEIQTFDLEETLGNKRKEKAALDLQLAEKGKPPASEEKKALAKLELEIESLETALEQKRTDKEFWTNRIELINRYKAQENII